MASMSEHPDRDRVAADERQIGVLLRAVEAPAPAALHERIAAIAAERPPRRRLLGTGWPAPRRGGFPLGIARPHAFGWAGAFAAAVAVTVVLVLALGTSATPPTALRASLVALASPTAPAPRTLVAAGTTIPFPAWSARGWPAVGTRSDRIGGRTVTTEFYRSYDGGTLGYSIVSGAPLGWGGGGRTVTRSGAEYRVLNADGAHIVAWVQAGHTCVLASRTATDPTLVALAVAQDSSSPA
jgi:hypothetical protein